MTVVRTHAPQKSYYVDELAKAKGHEVLRLAPYDCDLNPIEMLWAQARVMWDGGLGPEAWRLSDREAVASVSPSAWARCCKHVVRLEEEYWERENVAKEVERVVVSLASSRSESDEENEEEAD